jgi:UDPglucose 6-dehydrogenase
VKLPCGAKSRGRSSCFDRPVDTGVETRLWKEPGARGIGLDNRIGGKFLHAGPGFGGSCFPKDTLALIKTGQDYAAPLRIVETVAAVNDTRKRAMARKVAAAAGGNLRGKT